MHRRVCFLVTTLNFAIPLLQFAVAQAKANVQVPTDSSSQVLSSPSEPNPASKDVFNYCHKHLSGIDGVFQNHRLLEICKGSEILQSSDCRSVNGNPIFHFDFKKSQTQPKKILVIGLLHGDETDVGRLVRYWSERLLEIEPRNQWRVIPIANPDGFEKKTRFNANGVDLNRNFPSKDWDRWALQIWEKQNRRNERRYPGPKSASEPETRCLIQHIENYKPDLIISLHAPYGVMDFDGPSVVFPKAPIPWRRIGNFPGSLGRYMWVDSGRPVLTVELPAKPLANELKSFESLHDSIGGLAQRLYVHQKTGISKASAGSPEMSETGTPPNNSLKLGSHKQYEP